MRQLRRLPSKREDHFSESKKLFFELLVEGGPFNEYTKAISLFVEFSLFIYKI